MLDCHRLLIDRCAIKKLPFALNIAPYCKTERLKDEKGDNEQLPLYNARSGRDLTVVLSNNILENASHKLFVTFCRIFANQL